MSINRTARLSFTNPVGMQWLCVDWAGGGGDAAVMAFVSNEIICSATGFSCEFGEDGGELFALLLSLPLNEDVVIPNVIHVISITTQLIAK